MESQWGSIYIYPTCGRTVRDESLPIHTHRCIWVMFHN